MVRERRESHRLATADAILSGDALQALAGLTPDVGYFVSASVAAVVALYGYHWIHRINHWLTWPLVVVMTGLTAAALLSPSLPAEAWTPGPFRLGPFMTVFAIVAGFQLGWAPYVSDYSRYLPADVGVRATFWWTYLPSALSAIWVFGLGAVLSTAGGPDARPWRRSAPSATGCGRDSAPSPWWRSSSACSR